MSWSFSGKLTNPEGFTDVESNLKLLQGIDHSTAGNNDAIIERDEQIETANKVASILLATEIFEHAEELTISMNGHAIPGHTKSEKGTYESLGINISVSKFHDEGGG